MLSTRISRFLVSTSLIFIALHIVCFISSEDVYRDSWPYNLPPHMKYRPENYPHYLLNVEKLENYLKQGKQPVGVTKMSLDEGEKFFMEYWKFDDHQDHSPATCKSDSKDKTKSGVDDDDDGPSMNQSLSPAFRPSMVWDHQGDQVKYSKMSLVADSSPNHNEESFHNIHNPVPILKKLQKRDFKCPIGTNDCSAIGHPNSCCPTSENCFAIQDTGLGPVGCCPKGSSCGGTIKNCDVSNTACPASLGGGCCIHNYICLGVGCVIDPTVVITTIITLSTIISSSSEITTLTTTSMPSLSLTCASNFQTCPESLGGGCCPTDRVCVAGNECPLPPESSGPTPATATGVVPVRPTSLSSSLSLETSTSDPTCPTGFYGCKAFHAGGCCRTGRNCDTTSCPPVTYTSVLGNGVTVVVPVGEGASTAAKVEPNCATGWKVCPLNEGGGCCPNGWQCGLDSCSNIGAKETINKENFKSAGKHTIIVNLNHILRVIGVIFTICIMI